MNYVSLFSIILLFSSLCFGAIELRNSDFEFGTYILDQPGEYIVMEDIIFNPNNVEQLGVSPYEAGDVQPSQMSKYPPSNFGVGFFAAIAISATDVVLDLNGHTIIQHPEFALQQRFYAQIELADRPFIPNQGPHNFGPVINSATNVVIKNGVLGLSSHHGIHGNNPVNVTIMDLEIVDYEVAAIAVNGAQGLRLERVRSIGSREDLPVLGTFSAGRFMRPYVNHLLSTNYEGTLRIQGNDMTISDIYNDLRDSLNNAYDDIITNQNGNRGGYINPVTHPDEYALYHNKLHIVDGNAYGFLLNKPGVAVNNFPEIPEIPSNSVEIIDCEIRNHVANINEILIFFNEDNQPVIDAVGAAFQFLNKHPDTGDYISLSSNNLNNAVYTGNAVANAQAFVAKASRNNGFNGSPLDLSRISISSDIIDWIEADPSSPEAILNNFIVNHPLLCNGDSMVHVNKGVIGMKLDAAQNVLVDNVRISNITNYGNLGSTLCDYDTTTISNPFSILPGYQGATARGVSFSGSVGITVKNTQVEDIIAYSGSSYCFDVLLDSHDINILDTSCNGVVASKNHVDSDYTGPNALPEAIGYHAPTTASRVTCTDFFSKGDFKNNANGKIALIDNDAVGALDYSEYFSSTFNVGYDDDDDESSNTDSSNSNNFFSTNSVSSSSNSESLSNSRSSSSSASIMKMNIFIIFLITLLI